MHTHEIHVAGGREAVSEIRQRLFLFSEVLEVLATSRPNSLVVVFSGRPRPAVWNGHLRDAGYVLLRNPANPSRKAVARSHARPRRAFRSPGRAFGRSDRPPFESPWGRHARDG
ncbi:MAG TPA: hypothetical protein VGW98_08555 [Solirubrobacteraceae bacterium]|nr:hypothetical protein [Solirubrobacteraceae bacterium]